MEKEKPNYYAIIPADIRYDQNLCANAKLLYAEITALSNKQGYCFATNNYFENLYKVTDRSVRRWLSELAVRHIRIELLEGGNGIERNIYLTNSSAAASAKKIPEQAAAAATPPSSSTKKNKILPAERIQEMLTEILSQEAWVDIMCIQNRIPKDQAPARMRAHMLTFLNEKNGTEELYDKTAEAAKKWFVFWLKFNPFPKGHENLNGNPSEHGFI